MRVPTVSVRKGEQVATVNESDLASWVANGWAPPPPPEPPKQEPPPPAEPEPQAPPEPPKKGRK